MATANGEEGDYFSSYDGLVVHELMLRDRPRTLAYKEFIEKNATRLFAGKIVMDVGAGTGILSLFAAKAGASHVYAVEASGMSESCRRIVTDNSLSDRITIIAGKVEDIVLPDPAITRVDIIISEWMGFYLLHESMLRSVISARDRFLAPNGLMVPSQASLYLCPVSLRDYYRDNFEFWSDVYGFDFGHFLPAVRRRAFSQPAVIEVAPGQCLAGPELVARLDLKYVAVEDLEVVRGAFNFEMTAYGILQGFASWFDVRFDGGDIVETNVEEDLSLQIHEVELSTGPNAPLTHWKQTVICLPQPLMVSDGEIVSCGLELRREKGGEGRRYEIQITMEEMADSDDDKEDNDDREGREKEGEARMEAEKEIVSDEVAVKEEMMAMVLEAARSHAVPGRADVNLDGMETLNGST